MNDEIFKYINPDDNDKLSTLSGLDLQDLLILINNYCFELRDELKVDKDITIGLELEFEKAKKNKIERKMNNGFTDKGWTLKNDSSLNKGAEIVSPVLTDSKENWNDLDNICSIIRPYASIKENSSGHIHIGTQILGNSIDNWLNFIKLWATYENIIFRFSYGNYLTARPKIYKYAQPMSNQFWDNYCKLKGKTNYISDVVHQVNDDRYHAVNFRNVWNYTEYCRKNTIEFRCPNGTLDPAIWQNNVNLFIHLLNYSKSNEFNDDIIEKRHETNSNIYNIIPFYDELFLSQALELCDSIFDNNLDKINFLRQYIKTFEYKKRNNYNKNIVESITKTKELIK